MAEMKYLNTRIQLKYDTYGNWKAKNPTLLSGEIAIAKLVNDNLASEVNNETGAPVLFKVGPGAFNDLPWASALAADVYGWAKKETPDWNDFSEIPASKLPSVAIDTDTNTTYAFAIVEGKLQVTETPHTLGVAGTPVITSYDFVTPAELAKELENYYTKDEIDVMVGGKLHTQVEIETIAAAKINALIEGAESDDVIANITNLVEYVNDNADAVVQLTTDVGTANTNASAAVTTANEAKNAAQGASTVAGEAKELAQSAKETAETAQNNATASATAAADSAAAAAGSATTAAGHANTATTKASEASTSAANAAASEANAASSAEDAAFAKTGAEASAEAAEDAQTKAETAQASASASAEAAEAAKQAALDSNTSATAIANEAKAAAEAATEASNAATEAVAGLHAIATSGSLYDAEEVSTAKNKDDAGVETEVACLIFYCGDASTLI